MEILHAIGLTLSTKLTDGKVNCSV